MATRRHNDQEINRIDAILSRFAQQSYPLPGISNQPARTVFIKQLIDSIRRVNFVGAIELRGIDHRRLDPNDVNYFDPIRAALLHKSAGNFDEACWLVFLFTHFGKHPVSKWRYIREVYGKLGDHPHWSWEQVSVDSERFREWLHRNKEIITRGINRGFGGHRSYISIDAYKPHATGSAVISYVNWVADHGGHRSMIANALAVHNDHPGLAFNYLYQSMDSVDSFGRLAKFDYLTMLAKVGLAEIVPASPYLSKATGPHIGARYLLQATAEGGYNIREMENRLFALGQALGVDMQVIEDALCNWQKSRDVYQYYKG